MAFLLHHGFGAAPASRRLGMVTLLLVFALHGAGSAAQAATGSCDGTGFDSAVQDWISAPDALSTVQAYIDYLKREFVEVDTGYPARLVEAFSRGGLSHSDQALLLSGESWAAINGAALAPAGQTIAWYVRAKQLDFYDKNLRPLETSRGKLLAKNGPTQVSADSMATLAGQMQTVQATEATLNSLMDEALALEVRRGIVMVNALSAAEDDAFYQATLAPLDQLLFSLPTRPSGQAAQEEVARVSAEMSAIATAAQDVKSRGELVPLQITTELGQTTTDIQCPSVDDTPPPPELLPD